MFVYMFAYLQGTFVDVTDDRLGQVISMSFLVLNAVAAVLPALLLEPLSKVHGRVKVHAVCMAAMALAYAAIATSVDNVVVLYVLMGCAGIGWSAIISLPFAIMSEKVQQGKMGMYMGLFNLSVVLPQLVVSLGIGLIISQSPDKGIVFQVSMISLALSALCWWKIYRDESQTANA